MIRSSRRVIDELVGYGVDFARKADGSFDYTAKLSLPAADPLS